MDVNVPFGFDNEELEELQAREKARAEVLQRTAIAPSLPLGTESTVNQGR
jgi:muconolactone delta-isomerase